MGSSKRAALRISLTYALVSGLWVTFSDRATLLLPAEWSLRLQTVKGLLFVVVTSLVIYGLVRRWAEQTRQEIRHSESLERVLGQVVDTVPVGVMLLTNDGLITFMNPAAESLLGVRSVDAVGNRLDELGVMDERTGTASLGTLLSTGALDGVRLTDPATHDERAVIARAAAIDESTPGSGWVVAVADITGAQDSRERVDRLLKGYQFLSDIAIAVAKTGDSRTVLREVCEMAVERAGFMGVWAYLRGEESSGQFENFFCGLGESTKSVAKLLMETYESDGQVGSRLMDGEIVVYNDVGHDPRSPWYSATKDERIGSVASLAIAGPSGMRATITLFAPVAGYFAAEQVAILKMLRGSVGFAIDRIELDRKRIEAEDALEASEISYRSLFESNPEPMWVYDIETLDFLAVNDAAIARYGYTRDEFLRMRLTDVRPESEIPRLMERVRNRQVTGFVDVGTWRHRDSNGNEFDVHVRLHSIQWNERSAGLAMLTDAAERR